MLIRHLQAVSPVVVTVMVAAGLQLCPQLKLDLLQALPLGFWNKAP